MFKLPFWRLTNKYPAFYDTESGTAIEQTAKLYGAMRDLIDAYNKFVEETNNAMEAHGEATSKEHEEFETAIRQEFQDFIDTIELRLNGMPDAEAVAEISSKLSGLDHLLTEFEELKASVGKTYVLDGTYYMNDHIDLTPYNKMRWEGWYCACGSSDPSVCGFYVSEECPNQTYGVLGVWGYTRYYDSEEELIISDPALVYDGDGGYWVDSNDITFHNEIVPEWLYRLVTENGVKQ